MNTKKTSVAATDVLLDSQLCFALYSANLAMNKVYRKLLADMNLTYPQYLAMLVLWQRDGITMSQLGENLYLDSATLTPLVKRLQSAGLLTRERGTEDERQVLIRLTAEGRKLKRKASEVQNGAFCATGCTSDRLQAIKAELELLRANLIQHI